MSRDNDSVTMHWDLHVVSLPVLTGDKMLIAEYPGLMSWGLYKGLLSEWTQDKVLSFAEKRCAPSIFFNNWEIACVI